MSATFLSPTALKQVVATTLATEVPDGHTNALVGTVDASGAQVLVSFKFGSNNRWQATGAARHAWSGENQVGAALVYSW